MATENPAYGVGLHFQNTSYHYEVPSQYKKDSVYGDIVDKPGKGASHGYEDTSTKRYANPQTLLASH
jgi:hypothetical protein